MWRSKRCRRTTARRGVDHVSTEQYGANLDVNLVRLGEALRTDSYRPQSIRRHDIPKHVLGPAFGRTRGPGSQEKRPLGIPTVQDRVVQTALRMVIEPIFERDFAAQSYGFRPGRGCKEALRRVDELLKSHPCGRCRSEKLPPGQAPGACFSRSRRTVCWPLWPAKSLPPRRRGWPIDASCPWSRRSWSRVSWTVPRNGFRNGAHLRGR
jgi:hypothetical protein